MKTIAAPFALLLAVSVMQAQAPAKPATPAAPAPEAPAAKPAEPAKPPAKKEVKKEELPKIPGTNIARPNGTWLSLQVVGGRFQLTFYDAKKKPMAPDVTRARARWENVRGRGDNSTMMNPSGNALVGEKPAQPPFNMNIFITLLKGEGENMDAVENYSVRIPTSG